MIISIKLKRICQAFVIIFILMISAACYGPQRNALRFLIVEHFEDDLKKQSWHLEGMTYREGLWGWFFSCDKDKDQYLNSVELFACAKEVNFFARPGQDNELTKYS